MALISISISIRLANWVPISNGVSFRYLVLSSIRALRKNGYLFLKELIHGEIFLLQA